MKRVPQWVIDGGMLGAALFAGLAIAFGFTVLVSEPTPQPPHPAALLDRAAHRAYICADLRVSEGVAVCVLRDGSRLVLADGWGVFELAPVRKSAQTRIAGSAR